MKANRKFVHADRAVSPVIATILMVAIAVVLAGTVFAIVAVIASQRQDTAPTFGANSDDRLDRITIARPGAGADWNRLELSADRVTLKCAVNAESTAMSACSVGTAGTFVDIVSASDEMSGGDYLDLCITPANAEAVKIRLRDADANQIVGEWTFLDMVTCA